MSDLELPSAQAYLSWDRWVADCPRCTDARAVYPEDRRTGKPSPVRVLDQTCAAGHSFHIVMPSPKDEAEIAAEMAQRPPPSRFWHPLGHPMRPAPPDDLPPDQSPTGDADA